MKIRTDKDARAGSARRAVVAPELFSLDQNGYIQVAEIDVPPGEEERARHGALACPERLVLIEEDGSRAFTDWPRLITFPDQSWMFIEG